MNTPMEAWFSIGSNYFWVPEKRGVLNIKGMGLQ
jgi:hypothetical protein